MGLSSPSPASLGTFGEGMASLLCEFMVHPHTGCGAPTVSAVLSPPPSSKQIQSEVTMVTQTLQCDQIFKVLSMFQTLHPGGVGGRGHQSHSSVASIVRGPGSSAEKGEVGTGWDQRRAGNDFGGSEPKPGQKLTGSGASFGGTSGQHP